MANFNLKTTRCFTGSQCKRDRTVENGRVAWCPSNGAPPRSGSTANAGTSCSRYRKAAHYNSRSDKIWTHSNVARCLWNQSCTAVGVEAACGRRSRTPMSDRAAWCYLEAGRLDPGSMAVWALRHLGLDRRPHTRSIICLTECCAGRKRSGSRVGQEDSQVQQPVIQPLVLPCGCRDSWRTGWWWTQVHSGNWQEGCTMHCWSTGNHFSLPTLLDYDSEI